MFRDKLTEVKIWANVIDQWLGLPRNIHLKLRYLAILIKPGLIFRAKPTYDLQKISKRQVFDQNVDNSYRGTVESEVYFLKWFH